MQKENGAVFASQCSNLDFNKPIRMILVRTIPYVSWMKISSIFLVSRITTAIVSWSADLQLAHAPLILNERRCSAPVLQSHSQHALFDDSKACFTLTPVIAASIPQGDSIIISSFSCNLYSSPSLCHNVSHTSALHRHHHHHHKYQAQTSSFESISASIIQGSGIGPATYIVNAAYVLSCDRIQFNVAFFTLRVMQIAVCQFAN